MGQIGLGEHLRLYSPSHLKLLQPTELLDLLRDCVGGVTIRLIHATPVSGVLQLGEWVSAWALEVGVSPLYLGGTIRKRSLATQIRHQENIGGYIS